MWWDVVQGCTEHRPQSSQWLVMGVDEGQKLVDGCDRMTETAYCMLSIEWSHKSKWIVGTKPKYATFQRELTKQIKAVELARVGKKKKDHFEWDKNITIAFATETVELDWESELSNGRQKIRCSEKKESHSEQIVLRMWNEQKQCKSELQSEDSREEASNWVTLLSGSTVAMCDGWNSEATVWVSGC